MMLPRCCGELGLEFPPSLRRYIDLREVAQSYFAAVGPRHVRAHSLRQICDALRVPMRGEARAEGDEHCGLDDSRMVLLAMQQPARAGAELGCIDADAERAAWRAGDSVTLCLDGLPYHAVGWEVFVHRSEFPPDREPSRGDAVRFDIVRDGATGRTRAVSVSVLRAGGAGF